jgi:hypothetical protein
MVMSCPAVQVDPIPAPGPAYAATHPHPSRPLTPRTQPPSPTQPGPCHRARSHPPPTIQAPAPVHLMEVAQPADVRGSRAKPGGLQGATAWQIAQEGDTAGHELQCTRQPQAAPLT